MTPIPRQALELPFPDTTNDGHAFARETKREKPMPLRPKPSPLDLARQIELADNDRFFACGRRWGERQGESLSIPSISQMPIAIAGQQPIFRRKAHEPLHEPIGMIDTELGPL